MIEPNWSTLSHSLGGAEDLPTILRDLSPDSNAPVWGELWDRVCHQGTTYTASPYVLPRLLQAARSWEGRSRTMPLMLAGNIVGSSELKISGFEDVVSALHHLAQETASARDLSRSDRIFIMSSCLTFGGDLIWGPALSRLHDEELMGLCTACDAEFTLAIGDDGYFATKRSQATHSARWEEIAPCNENSLGRNAAWMHDIAVAVGDAELAIRIRCVFGQSVCPVCGAHIAVAEAIERFESQ